MQSTTFSERCTVRIACLPTSGEVRACRRRAGLRVIRAFMVALALSAHPVAAEPTMRDLQVLARAIGFLERTPNGTAEIGIVYPQQSEAGRSEANRIATAFGSGLRAGSLIAQPRLLTVEEAGQVKVVALLLTEAAAPQAAQVAAAVAGRSILTVTSTRDLIESGSVVMVVRGEPRVEILVNRAAAQAAGVNFAAAFRMMIQER